MIERELTQLELKDIEGELQRIVLGAGLPNSPVRQQFVLAERGERLVDVAAAEKATAETADTAAVAADATALAAAEGTEQ